MSPRPKNPVDNLLITGTQYIYVWSDEIVGRCRREWFVARVKGTAQCPEFQRSPRDGSEPRNGRFAASEVAARIDVTAIHNS
jgi:hypothetical protein